MRIIFLSIWQTLLFVFPALCQDEFCLYQLPDGKVKQVNSKDLIPPELRGNSRCFKTKKGEYLAAPQDVKLSGNIRRENMASSIGRIEMRWPRKVEVLFGRTPQRAMADAATTASRALKASSFSPQLQTLNLDWNIVFMDEEMPEQQIPSSLITNCHPAWMTPPANIYVVAQRVVAGCGEQRSPGTKVADSQLAHILLHEIGHAVEFRLLQGFGASDRMRAEGFASWFEQYASDFSAVIPKGSIRRNYYALAKRAFLEQPTISFNGSAADYARASMFFSAIHERKGVRGVMDVYETMIADKISFFPAIEKKLFWDQKKLMQEIMRVLDIR